MGQTIIVSKGPQAFRFRAGLTSNVGRRKSPRNAMQRRIAVLVYPGSIFFEIALAVEVLSPVFAIDFYSPDGLLHRASNGACINVVGDLSDLKNAGVVAVLIPGGDPKELLVPIRSANAALQAQAARGALIAGICAGNLVIAGAGLLQGRTGTHNYTPEYANSEQVATTQPFWEGMTYVRADVVKDGMIITAMPWAYRRFAALVAQELGALSEAEAAALETYVHSRSIGVA